MRKTNNVGQAIVQASLPLLAKTPCRPPNARPTAISWSRPIHRFQRDTGAESKTKAMTVLSFAFAAACQSLIRDTRRLACGLLPMDPVGVLPRPGESSGIDWKYECGSLDNGRPSSVGANVFA